MSTVELSFVTAYNREVHLAYQRGGSLLRGMARTQTGVVGKEITFQKIGSGTARSKTRHGMVPVMNLDHSTVTCPISDKYAGEWVDDLDLLKTNVDERGALAEAQGAALGRATDEQIIDALDDATNTTALVTTSTKTFRNSMLEARQALRERNAPNDKRLFAVIPPSLHSWLLTIPEYASADYTGPELPWRNPNDGMRSWLGYNWVEHTGLGLSGTTRTGFIWHQNAIGHAIQKEVTMKVSWENTRAAWFFNAYMAMGACLIDNNGVQKITLDENVDLPTS